MQSCLNDGLQTWAPSLYNELIINHLRQANSAGPARLVALGKKKNKQHVAAEIWDFVLSNYMKNKSNIK